MVERLNVQDPLFELNPEAANSMRWRGGVSSFAKSESGRPESWQTGYFGDRYAVEPIGTTNEAKAFVTTHHYSGSFPNDRFRYGMYEKSTSALVGVAVLSIPSNDRTLTNVFPQLRPSYESLELGRFVLLDEVPNNAESWFLGRIKPLAKREGVLGILAASDPVPRTDADGKVLFSGHFGLIYQAINALYCGRQTKAVRWLLPDGRVFDGRTQNKVRNPDRDRGIEGVRRMLAGYGIDLPDAGQRFPDWMRELAEEGLLRPMRHPGNHRYAIPLDSKVQIGLTVQQRPRGVDPVQAAAAIELGTARPVQPGLTLI